MSLVSTLNSTATPLSASAVFTGTYEDVSSYSSISVIGLTDQSGTLQYSFSTNGTNADSTVTLSASTAALGAHSLAVTAKYFRIILTNGSVGQTFLRLQTIYQTITRTSLQTYPLATTPTNYADALTTRSITQGQDYNGQIYENVQLNNANALRVSVRETVGGYGGVLSTLLTPMVRICANNGYIEPDVISQSAGGSVTLANNFFVTNSGTVTFGYGYMRSRRIIRLLAGHAMRIRFTAKWGTAPTNASAEIGFFNNIDGISFGYDSSGTFGLVKRFGGASGIYTLTFNTGQTAAASVNHTITVDGIPTTPTPINTTTILTAAQLAETIGKAISVSNYQIDYVSNTIVFMQFFSYTSGYPTGFSYSTTGTATATWSQQVAGAPVDNATGIVAQTAWNYDTCDGTNSVSNPSGFLLNPQNVNAYQIVVTSDEVRYYLLGNQGYFELVHISQYNNTLTSTILQNTGFQVGNGNGYFGSGIPAISYLYDAAAFISDGIEPVTNTSSFTASTTANTTDQVYFAFRNRLVMNNMQNMKLIIPRVISVASETSGRVITISLWLNPTVTGLLNWTYYNSTNSIMERSSGLAAPSGVTVTGGTLIASFTVGTSPTDFDLSALSIQLIPQDTVVVTCSTATLQATMSAALDWIEL